MRGAPQLTVVEKDNNRELARRARAGCRSSFAELVRRYAGSLRDFLLTRVRDSSEADDLVQESFLAAWEKIEQYDERWSFSTWLFTIAQRLVVDGWRKRRPELASGQELECEGAERDPHDNARLREERDNLWDLAREVLTEDQFSALWLSYAEGAETSEIAHILGRARTTVRVLLYRARGTLRAQLSIRTKPLANSGLHEDTPSGAWVGGRS